MTETRSASLVRYRRRGRVSTNPSRVVGAVLLGLVVTLAACSSVPRQAPEPGRPTDLRGAQRPRVVEVAMQYRGAPYRGGGEGPSEFDCSGFVRFVYAQLGVSLPHNAAQQYQLGTAVSREDLQPGDL